MDMPFYSQAGIEFTYLLASKNHESDFANIAVTLMKLEFQEKNIKPWVLGIDEKAIEIASLPMSNLEQMRKFHSSVDLIAKRLKLVTHRKDVISGGGHVHIGVKPEIKEDPMLFLAFVNNIFRDINNRPYLNWIFNEPHNIQSAQSLSYYRDRKDSFGGGYDSAKFIELLKKGQNVEYNWDSNRIFNIYSEPGKGYAVRLDHHSYADKPSAYTIEFRFFDAKRSWNDVRRHLNFANAYMKYMEEKTLRGEMVPIKVLKPCDIDSFKDKCIPQFKRLLKELSLDYAEYEEFVVNNYEYRKRINTLK